jgi:hypothetical protein
VETIPHLPFERYHVYAFDLWGAGRSKRPASLDLDAVQDDAVVQWFDEWIIAFVKTYTASCARTRSSRST